MQSSDVDQKKQTFQSGSLIIWLGIVAGNAEGVLNIIYVLVTKFSNAQYAKACVTFILLQPIWYFFVYVLFIGQSLEIQTRSDRGKKILFAPVYTCF